MKAWKIEAVAAVVVGLIVALSLSLAHGQTSLLPLLKAIRQDYGTPMSPVQIGQFLNRVAKAGGPEWGLLEKGSGNRCPTPQGIDVSCDYLVYKPTMDGWDVLEDAEGKAVPRWSTAPNDNFASEPERWIAAVNVGQPPEPTPDPDPAPTPDPPPIVDLGPILSRLEALEAKASQLQAELDAAEAKLDAHHAQIEALTLRPNPWPAYRGSLFGAFPIRVTPEPLP